MKISEFFIKIAKNTNVFRESTCIISFSERNRDHRPFEEREFGETL